MAKYNIGIYTRGYTLKTLLQQFNNVVSEHRKDIDHRRDQSMLVIFDLMGIDMMMDDRMMNPQANYAQQAHSIQMGYDRENYMRNIIKCFLQFLKSGLPQVCSRP